MCALNVSGRCFDIWPDDGSFEQKNVAEFLILITIYIYIYIYILLWGTAVAQWLRCCATNRKVSSSIPDAVIRILR